MPKNDYYSIDKINISIVKKQQKRTALKDSSFQFGAIRS